MCSYVVYRHIYFFIEKEICAKEYFRVVFNFGDAKLIATCLMYLVIKNFYCS